MKKDIKILSISIIGILVGILWISNPTETTYLKEISVEYSKYHNDMEISHEVLRNIGKKKRNNYILFSTYSYKFGNLTYFYFGAASRVYSMGYSYEEKNVNPTKII